MVNGINPRVVELLLIQIDKSRRLLQICNQDYNDPRFTDRHGIGPKLTEQIALMAADSIKVGSLCLHIKWDPPEFVKVCTEIEEGQFTVENIDKPGELYIAYRRNLRLLK